MGRKGLRCFASWMIAAALWGVAATAFGQSWASAYEQGLSHARKGEWMAARNAFKQAAAYRPEDQAAATMLPGPATERRTWRNGSPYSPNFLAAYSGYRASGAIGDSNERNALMRTAAAELEILLSKNQISAETFYVLNMIYSTVGDTAARVKLDERMNATSGQWVWKVDNEVVSPEEMAAINQMAGRDVINPTTPVTDPGTQPTTNPGTNPTLPSMTGARVPTLANKFALIIGNSESRLQSGAIPFAMNDAQALRESLLANAGYAESNVDLVLNATAAQIGTSVQALADRIPNGATVFIYFSGVGANLAGKDYLAGVDTESPTDSSSMFAKADLFRPLMAKEARIFAFFQVNRTIAEGRYFGMEVPLFGSVAQMQGTMPGDTVQSYVRDGKERGIFTDAMIGVLGEFRTNRIPILEYGWQVFYRIRRGGTGTAGGGSRQTPTLPVLTNIGEDAKF
jgi:hypothetical protein